MSMVHRILLVLAVLFVVLGLGFTIAGTFSPAWQVVDIREFRAEHQHGLWWDCIRAERHVVAVGDFYDEAPLHCMYKFDRSAEFVIDRSVDNVDEDGAAGESEHHRFWMWHKIVLIFIVASEVLAFTAICTGAMAPCFRTTTLVFTVALFLAMLCSLIADGVFFLSANRVDSRFVQGMVGTYEQQIGYAFYLHIIGTVCWLISFILSIMTTYKFFTDDHSEEVAFPLPPIHHHHHRCRQHEPQHFEEQHDPLLSPNRARLARPAQSSVPRVYQETST